MGTLWKDAHQTNRRKRGYEARIEGWSKQTLAVFVIFFMFFKEKV